MRSSVGPAAARTPHQAGPCRYSQTPLWAGIYLVPLTVGFLAAAPLSGILSDKFGPKRSR